MNEQKLREQFGLATRVFEPLTAGGMIRMVGVSVACDAPFDPTFFSAEALAALPDFIKNAGEQLSTGGQQPGTNELQTVKDMIEEFSRGFPVVTPALPGLVAPRGVALGSSAAQRDVAEVDAEGSSCAADDASMEF